MFGQGREYEKDLEPFQASLQFVKAAPTRQVASTAVKMRLDLDF